jgi:hypothetical protein
MTAPTVQNQKPQPLDTMFDALEAMLREQMDAHEKLLPLLDCKREAVRHADLETISQVMEQERLIIARIAEIERNREQLVYRITQQIQPEATKPLPISAIAERAAEPVQTRLMAMAAQLRDLVKDVRERSSVIRSAVEALSNHLSGVMQTVNAALSRAGVYGRQGRLATGDQMQHSVDVKT